MNAGLVPTHRDNLGQNFLHEVCKVYSANPEYLEDLEKAVENGLEIDGRDCERRTPLMNAARVGGDRFVGFLLRHGADPDAKDNNGRTPLFEAVTSHYTTAPVVVNSLLEGGANATEPGPYDQNLLDMAIRRGLGAIAELLKEAMELKGVDP